MDASHSPDAAARGDHKGQGTAEEPSEPGETWSLATLFRRATGALGNGSSNGALDADPKGGAAEDLGPLFASSSPGERAMVTNILRLREIRVEDVMTPRADIVAVSEEAALDEVMHAFQCGSLSRLPVYHETLDDPIGFVHLKDLALAYGVGCQKDTQPFDVRKHLRTALFVPPSMRIATLLQRMQASRVHMALVIDEFGGVDGLVTIEDLVEQIVGDIEDEHDTEDLEQWREEAPGIYLVNARTDIREFEEAVGRPLVPDDWDEDVDTLGGLVFMLTGRVPARGEVIGHPLGHEFQVTDADPRRIRRLRVTLVGAGPAPGAERRVAAAPGPGATGPMEAERQSSSDEPLTEARHASPDANAPTDAPDRREEAVPLAKAAE
ncbi:MAG: hemolysin family protein [Paracoccaceae bacterium]